MDWLDKIPQWIKIPIKVLLPSLALFSGFIVLASDKVLDYLNLLEFEQKNGFAFSIIFLVCSCLIVCYISWFAIEKLIEAYKSHRIKSLQFKQFTELADVYRDTLFEMYRSPTKSLTMSYSSAVTTYLMAIKAIGSSQISKGGVLFDFYLQPWVIRCIDKAIEILRKLIKKQENKILKCSNEEAKQTLAKQLNNYKSHLDYLITPSKNEDDDYCSW